MTRTTQPTTAEERAAEIVRAWVEEDAGTEWNTGTFAQLEARIVSTLAAAIARAEEAEEHVAALRDANANWPAMYRMYAEQVSVEKNAKREAEAERDALRAQVAALWGALEAVQDVLPGYAILADTTAAAQAHEAAIRRAVWEEAAQYVEVWCADDARYVIQEADAKMLANNLRARAAQEKGGT